MATRRQSTRMELIHQSCRLACLRSLVRQSPAPASPPSRTVGQTCQTRNPRKFWHLRPLVRGRQTRSGCQTRTMKPPSCSIIFTTHCVKINEVALPLFSFNAACLKSGQPSACSIWWCNLMWHVSIQLPTQFFILVSLYSYCRTWIVTWMTTTMNWSLRSEHHPSLSRHSDPHFSLPSLFPVSLSLSPSLRFCSASAPVGTRKIAVSVDMNDIMSKVK